ncbi:MAG: mechanosensitive ion channel family protein [Synechococcaceae cyanobacterium SM2_3_2]|nr:mechanosensitive ion channel family protein [Synechococcaceae cyanobacterium SM2_3_2]
MLQSTPADTSGEVETGEVRLDGRILFAVAGSQPVDIEAAFPLQQRIKFIEDRLLQLAQSDFRPHSLRVESQMDPDTNQPVITVNGQYLLTITSLDAQLQGLDPEIWAEQVSEIIREALLLFRQERQPEFLWRRGGISLSLLVGTWLLSAGLERWRRQLILRRDRVHTELLQIPKFPVMADAEHRSDPTDLSLDHGDNPDNAPDSEQDLGSPHDAQFVQRLHRLELRLDLEQRLLWLVQVMAWGSAFGIGVGLFPQTRWIQVMGLRWLQGPILRLGSTALATYVAVRISAYSIETIFRAVRQNQWLIIQPETTTQDRISKRIVTLSSVVKGVTATLLSLIGVIAAIGLLGINVVPLVTSLGVIGLGVSLAAQDLIKDLINGLMILLEDQYAEGDVIMIDGRGGLVERINLRITQLRNTEGTLITIPNSAIRVVENLSNGWARVDLSILVSYSTDLDRAMQVIETVAVRMSRDWEWKERILDNPQMLGVDKFDPDGVILRIWIKVRPLAQWDVAREFRRRVMIALNQNGIQLPVPQRQIWIQTSGGSQGSSALAPESGPD